jgi:hypothetical protein
MIKEYVKRYSKAREISEAEAVNHATVKEVIKYYKENDNAGRNAEVESRAKCEGD